MATRDVIQFFIRSSFGGSSMSVEDRLLRYSSVDTASVHDGVPCRKWHGWMDKYGYGKIKVDGKTCKAHRIAYKVLGGKKLDTSKVLDHRCRNRNCIEPAHLEPVSMVENTLRGMSFAGQNKRKIWCPREHKYTIENTIVRHGKRYCRACEQGQPRNESVAEAA